MPSPAALPFFVTNILDVAAFGALDIELTPRLPGWQISGNVPDLSKIALAPHETKKIVLNLGYEPPQSDEPDQPSGGDEVVNQDFDITFRLEGQVLGGVSSHVRVVPAARRDWSLSLHLGEASLQGDFGHLYDEGPSVVFDAGYRLTRSLSLIGLLGYHRFDAAAAGVSDNDLWSLSIDLRWAPRTGRVRPYLQAGPGVYFPESGSSEAGYNLGIGMSFEVTPAWDLEVGANYHAVPGFVPDVEFFQPLVGLIYRF